MYKSCCPLKYRPRTFIEKKFGVIGVTHFPKKKSQKESHYHIGCRAQGQGWPHMWTPKMGSLYMFFIRKFQWQSLVIPPPPWFDGLCVCPTGYTFINKNFKIFTLYHKMKKHLGKIQKILKVTFYSNIKTLWAISDSKFGLIQISIYKVNAWSWVFTTKATHFEVIL